MKTLRLVLGILSIIFAFFMLLSSCAGGFTGGLIEDENLIENSSQGIIISFIILASGITAICTRKSKIGSIITGIIYLLAYIVSIADTYTDLGSSLGTIALILAIIFILTAVIQFFTKPKKNK